VASSTDRDAIAAARQRQVAADQIVRRAGRDVETELRIDRSKASALNRAAIESDASLLLLAWPGREGVRGNLLGASYSEIIAATAVPVAIAALHETDKAGPRRTILLVREADLVPGQEPALRLAAELAKNLIGRDRTLVVGPLSPDLLAAEGISLPEHTEHWDGEVGGPEEAEKWVAERTEPGDLIILPFHELAIRASAIRIFDSGRSVLAVTHNPESQSGLGSSTLTLPIGGSFGS
jgi:hypothetical protein